MFKDIIYVDGSFDLLHMGHIQFFNKIKKDNDILIIGVISDNNIKSYKRNPIIDLENRVKMLQNLKIVDKVISDCPFGRITKEFIDKHKITKVFYAGVNHTWFEHYKIPVEMGIMNYIQYSDKEISTTKIINKILQSN